MLAALFALMAGFLVRTHQCSENDRMSREAPTRQVPDARTEHAVRAFLDRLPGDLQVKRALLYGSRAGSAETKSLQPTRDTMSQKPPRGTASAARADPAPVRCHTCRQVIAVYDGISYGSIESGYRQLCSRCFNEEIACAGGLGFQHVQFEPLETGCGRRAA